MRRAVIRRPSTASASASGEARLAAQHGGAERAEPRLGVHRRDRLDHAMHVRAHLPPVDVRLGQVQAEPSRPPCRFGSVRGGEQGLARHAAEVQAIAAHPVTLDQRHAQAELRGDSGHRETRGAGTDHRQIEFRHPIVSTAATRPAAGTVPPGRPAGQEREGRK